MVPCCPCAPLLVGIAGVKCFVPDYQPLWTIYRHGDMSAFICESPSLYVSFFHSWNIWVCLHAWHSFLSFFFPPVTFWCHNHLPLEYAACNWFDSQKVQEHQVPIPKHTAIHSGWSMTYKFHLIWYLISINFLSLSIILSSWLPVLQFCISLLHVCLPWQTDPSSVGLPEGSSDFSPLKGFCLGVFPYHNWGSKLRDRG